MGKVYIRLRAYNAEKTLRRAIKSVLKQTYQDFIFYICDNGSTDRTRQIIDFYAKKDGRIVPFYNKENMIFDETSVAFRDLPRQIGPDDCYCTLDADDEYFPTFFEDMLSFMEENHLDIACCGTEMLFEDEKQNRKPAGNRVLGRNLVLDEKQFAEYYPIYHCFMRPTWAKIFKGSTLCDMVTDPDQVANWPRAYGGDTIGSFGALRHAKRMGVLGKILHRYYITPKSVSHQFSPDRVSSDGILMADAIDFLQRYGPISTRNYNFAYVVYMNALFDTFRVIVQSEVPSAKKQAAIIEMCNCKYTIQLAAWQSLGEKENAMRKQLFSQIVRWMLSAEDVSDEQAEEFLACGEFAAAAAEQAEDWITFKKLRVAFLLESQREEEAKTIIAELSELDSQTDKYDISEENQREIAVSLETETDFSSYIDLLRQRIDRYMICIAVRDTPWGNCFTPILTEKLMTLGLKTNLYGKFRRAYAAVLNQGKLVFEQISPDTKKSVTWAGNIGRTSIRLESRGYEAAPSKAIIELNGQDYSASIRGLNIVIYDAHTETVVDSVNFDTWSDALTCTRPNALSNALAEWSAGHPEISVLCYNKPDFPSKNLTPNEQFIIKNVHQQGDSYRLIDHPRLPLRLFFDSKEDILEVITPPKSYHDISGVRRFVDMQGRQVHTAAGHRVTTDQPTKWRRTIYMVGGCSTFGIGASDRTTTASWLQRLCNENAPEEELIVENYGYYLANGDRESMEEIKILNSLPVKSGDIILCDWGFPSCIPLLDLSSEGERPHEYGEIFFDVGPFSGHLTENGYRLSAEKIFERLKKEKFYPIKAEKCAKFTQNEEEDNLSVRESSYHEELTAYKDRLKALYNNSFSVGAVVVNCNPFTLGHRYLVEQASKQCAHLIVFVVEEDRSYFPFQDRIQMVKDGLRDLQNVTILPSGKFILSSLTFLEYFNKAELQHRTVDASHDVNIFAKEIAPCLHITKRFVGSEPLDAVTQQYNREMQRTLPKYGIEFIEIERIQTDHLGPIISASAVREYIKRRDLSAIAAMVPLSTYTYIEKHLSLVPPI